MKAGGQDVLEKSAHELWSGQTASSRLFAIAWLDHESDALIYDGNDPAVSRPFNLSQRPDVMLMTAEIAFA